MMNNIIKSTLLLSLTAAVAFAAPAVRFNVIPGDQEEKHAKEFIPGLKAATGFGVSDPHEKINDAYEGRYGNPEDPDYDKDWVTNLDNLGFFAVTNDKKIREILISSPQVAGFAPFNFHTYKKIGEDVTYIGHIVPETMLDITGVTNTKDRKAFVNMFESLDEYTNKEFGGEVVISEYKSLPAKPMMTFEIDINKEEDLSDFIDSFQESLEENFEENKYIIAGYKNFKETYEDNDIEFDEYDAFFVYSLCHFTFSYNMFNKGRPDAGAFAPCSMYFYIKEGSDKMIVGMPRLATWVSVMEIKDETMIQSTKDLDAEIIGIMKELGAKEI